jgi:hypothetical protein
MGILVFTKFKPQSRKLLIIKLCIKDSKWEALHCHIQEWVWNSGFDSLVGFLSNLQFLNPQVPLMGTRNSLTGSVARYIFHLSIWTKGSIKFSFQGKTQVNPPPCQKAPTILLSPRTCSKLTKSMPCYKLQIRLTLFDYVIFSYPLYKKLLTR